MSETPTAPSIRPELAVLRDLLLQTGWTDEDAAALTQHADDNTDVGGLCRRAWDENRHPQIRGLLQTAAGFRPPGSPTAEPRWLTFVDERGASAGVDPETGWPVVQLFARAAAPDEADIDVRAVLEPAAARRLGVQLLAAADPELFVRLLTEDLATRAGGDR